MTMKLFEEMDDKVLYRDLRPFLYLNDDEEVKFGCMIKFRGLKGKKQDDSQL